MAAVLLATRIAVAADSEVDHIVQILGLKSDSRVAHVGAGSGEKSVAIASRVPRGIVYSTEVDPQLIDKIRNNVRKAQASNVIVITGRADDTQLPTDCCDGIFLREVYHHLTNSAAMDRSLYRSVRPDGRLAIIDFEPLPGTRPPAGVPANRSGHGAPKRIVEQELTAAGFELLKTIDWPTSSTVKHYCMLFRKRSGDVGADISQSRGSLSALPLFRSLRMTTLSGRARRARPHKHDSKTVALTRNCGVSCISMSRCSCNSPLV
jgi:ubiquinone/menaquinone biosynthesis C-methylase UbiE